jgi:hypothetical protein
MLSLKFFQMEFTRRRRPTGMVHFLPGFSVSVWTHFVGLFLVGGAADSFRAASNFCRAAI